MQNMLKMFALVLLALTATSFIACPAHAALGPGGFVYEGRMYDTAGYPSKQVLRFNVKVVAPNGCILLEETSPNFDLSTSDGYFNLTVGQLPATGNDPGLSLTQIFGGKATVNGKTSGGSTCPYAAADGDARVLRVTVIDSGGGQTVMSPDIAINATPHAMTADSLQGRVPTDFAQANSQGVLLPQLSSLPGGAVAGQTWFNTATHNLTYFDGSGYISVASGGGGGSPTPSYTSVTAATEYAPLIYGASGAGQTLVIDSTSNASKGSITIGSTGNIFFGAASGAHVGIGTTSTPATALDVNGTIRLGYGGESCSTPTMGALRFYTGNVQYCNGSSWTSFSTASFSAGTSTVPGLALLGASGTGLFSPASSTLSIATAGNETLRVTPSDVIIPYGRLGIGTMSPSELLSVEANANAAPLSIKIKNIDSTNGAHSQFLAEGDTTSQTLLGVTNTNNAESSLFPADAGYVGTSGSGGFNIYESYSGAPIRFFVNASGVAERMRIDSSGNVGIGTPAPVARLDVAGDINISNGRLRFGAQPVLMIPSNASGIAVGPGALASVTSGNYNVAVGDQVLNSLTTGSANTAVGSGAMKGGAALTGADNTVMGAGALQYAQGSASGNTVIGSSAGVGVTSGVNNILIGTHAGSLLQTGSGNIVIANNVSYPQSSASDTNRLNIGNILFGNLSSGRIGIGTATPQANLDVAGHVASSGASPTVSTCGTGASVTGTDTRGTITVGSTSTSTCTLTFNTTYTSIPVCVISYTGTTAPTYSSYVYSTTASQLVIGFSSAVTGYQINYYCMQ